MVGVAQKTAQKNGALNAGGRPPASLDLALEGLFYRLRNAGPWRDVVCLNVLALGEPSMGGINCGLAQVSGNACLPLSTANQNRIMLVDGTHVVVHQCAATPAGGADKQALCNTLREQHQDHGSY